MFKRRTPRPPLQRLRNFLFPYMGWRRTLKYWHYRTVRLPGTPTSIALGFASGAAISFTPFLFFHLLLAFALAWPIGGSLVAAAIGTLVGNPVTFVFIFPLIYKTGKWFLGMEGTGAGYQEIFKSSDGHSLSNIWEHAKLLFEPVLLPMMVGCIPWMIIAGGVSYFLCHKIVITYHLSRHERKSIRKRHHDVRIASKAATEIYNEKDGL